MDTIKLETNITVGKAKGFNGDIGKLQIASASLKNLIGRKLHCVVYVSDLEFEL